MTYSEDDKRLNEILEMIGRMAALEFSEPLETSDQHDMVDAIALGLNMLSEELSTNVVEKTKLDRVNGKLEKFAFTTAHDLRSPLNSLTGLITVLEYSLDRQHNKEAFDHIERMRMVIDKMKTLVQGILDYSRSSAEMEKELIDVYSVVQEIMEVDQLTGEATLRIDGELPLIHFHPSSFRQIVRNLLGNAVKYCDKEVCNIKVCCVEKGRSYVFQFEDNGPGILPENQQKIFELFNKLEVTTRADSHGIGLATVKSVLEGAGEKIWVESVPGNGATFCFTIAKQLIK